MESAHDSPAPASSHRTGRVILFLMLAMGAVIALAWMRHAAYPDQVPWREDITQARAWARTQQKPMLLNFTAAWCPPCRDMKRRVYSQHDIAAMIGNAFVPIKVDMTSPAPGSAEETLANDYQIQYLPTLILTDAHGQEQRRLSGFHEANDVKSWLTPSQSP